MFLVNDHASKSTINNNEETSVIKKFFKKTFYYFSIFTIVFSTTVSFNNQAQAADITLTDSETGNLTDSDDGVGGNAALATGDNFIITAAAASPATIQAGTTTNTQFTNLTFNLGASTKVNITGNAVSNVVLSTGTIAVTGSGASNLNIVSGGYSLGVMLQMLQES
jgi:hypothetical protein